MNSLTDPQRSLLIAEMNAVGASLLSFDGLDTLINETKYHQTPEEKNLNELARLMKVFRYQASALLINQENRKANSGAN